jgi:hypothetical protein
MIAMQQLTPYLFLSFFTCLSTTLYAQNDLEDKQLIIEKNRVMELSKANRLQNRMQKIENPPPLIEQTYQLNRIQATLPALQIQTTPFLQTQTEITPPIYPTNYIKGGFGNYTTLFGELFLQIPKKNNYTISLAAKHLSSASGSVLDDKSGSSRSNIAIKGSYQINSNSEISGQVNYQRIGVNYYGVNPIILKDWDNEKIKQTYQTFAMLLAYKAKVNENISYQTQANYYYFGTKTEVSENALAITASSNIKLSVDANIDLELDANFANRTDNTKTIARNLLLFKPLYKLQVDKIGIKIGATVVYDNDTLSQNKQFRLYPHIEIGYQIVSNMSVYGILTGSTQKTSLRQFANENNFIGNQISLLHTNKQWEIMAGVQGKISQNFGYHLKSSYTNYKNLYFFNNSLADSAKFAVFYDTEGTRVLAGMAEIYAQTNKLKASFKTDFFVYDTQTISKAWHRPTFVNTLLINYLYEKNIAFHLEVFNQNGLQGYNFVRNKSYELPSIVDVNLQASYLFQNNISIFLKLNNIFSQQYQQYLYYDMQKFNALLGVMWQF